jgi:hypothetical protein
MWRFKKRELGIPERDSYDAQFFQTHYKAGRFP